MIRILLLVMTLIFAYSTSADAGWLDDKLKQAAESIGDRLVDDAADSTYEGTKDTVTPDKGMQSEGSGQYGSEEAAEYEQAEGSAEFSDIPERANMDQPSWSESDYGQKPKKKKKTGPPRTDLHLTADMMMSDPESSPEPIKGKIYIDGAKTRTEFSDSGDYSMGMIVTGIDPADKVYILMHSNKMYMVSTYDETDSFIFVSGKPCDEFRKAEDLGRTKLNGRSVKKVRCSEPEDP